MLNAVEFGALDGRRASRVVPSVAFTPSVRFEEEDTKTSLPRLPMIAGVLVTLFGSSARLRGRAARNQYEAEAGSGVRTLGVR